MTGSVARASLHLPPSTWRDPAAWSRAADICAVLIALVLPWSTSLVAIFAVAFLVAMAPTITVASFIESLKRPICALPIALVVLALAGMLWSDAPWDARLYAVSPTAKFLVLPLLIYHFERSKRAMWVFVAFLVSCTALMILSWIVLYDPRYAIRADADVGVPVKNYIDQSQEFAACAVALMYPVLRFLRARRFVMAALLGALAISFIANMAFVTVSRTALVTTPVMLLIFALVHLGRRGIISTFVAMAVVTAGLWLISPLLRTKAESILSQYAGYRTSNESTSVGQRLEFWRKSVIFFKEAPVFGHGTGSARGLFERAAIGQTGASAEVIGNPHNQTLNVAVQWGTIGVLLLFAMWLTHLMLFRGRGLAAWIGLLIVTQNFASSIFNSHLFDFHEGWMYVLGVGVAAGIVSSRQQLCSPPGARWHFRTGDRSHPTV